MTRIRLTTGSAFGRCAVALCVLGLGAGSPAGHLIGKAGPGRTRASSPAPSEPHFSQMTQGFGQTCGLRTNGTVVCWGNDIFGEAEPPAGRHFVQVSAGAGMTCGREAAGNLVCWGDAGPVRGTFRDISVGGAMGSGGWIDIDDLASGVRTSGSLTCWGRDMAEFQADLAGRYTRVSVALDTSGGNDQSVCALRVDGRAVCWGMDYVYGQYDDYVSADSFVQVSAGFTGSAEVVGDSQGPHGLRADRCPHRNLLGGNQ